MAIRRLPGRRFWRFRLNGYKLAEETRVIVSESDRGRTFTLDLGANVTLRLKETPTTGYRWAVEVMEGFDLVSDRPEPGAGIGAAGARVLQFRAVRPGTHRLRLRNWRDWEGEKSAIEHFEVTMNVK
jgi:inhibitor of cysteine peptidase